MSRLSEQTAEKIFDKLAVMLSGGKFYWIELLDAICKEDRYISEYIGFRDGQRDWSVRSNKKVRAIRKRLMEQLPAYKDRILLFSTTPLRLAWMPFGD